MSDQEHFLTEALQKAVQIVSTVEDRYQEVAFPIVLQAIIGYSGKQEITKGPRQETNGYQVEPSLPPTLSVNAFFRRANPDSHPARFVTAAYYLLHTGKAEKFTQADILDTYRKLRQPQPKNPTDVVNQCIRKAYIIDAPDGSDKQRHWVITPDGEKFVEDLLHDNGNSSNSVVG
jgi:hypothetical protein